MKTSKKLLIAILVLLLGIAALVPATFSWYSHNGERSGVQMRYQRDDIPASDGTVSVETKKYKMDPDNLNKVFYDQKGNKEYIDSALTTDTLYASGDNARKVQYYGTTFTNSSHEDAYVNLYLQDFTNVTDVNIGTLQPNLTFKGLSSSVHQKNNSQIRVYFQWNNASHWNESGAVTYIVYKTKQGETAHVLEDGTGYAIIAQGSDHYSEMAGKNWINPGNDSGNILKGNKYTFYYDLPEGTTEFYFATDAKNSGFDTSTNTAKQAFYRTRSITNIQSETGYYLTGSVDDTTWNAEYKTFPVPGGISTKTSFDKLTINKSQSAYITLKPGTNYTGASATYAVTAGSNITVNGNTGYVTTNNSFGTSSSATITTTITGSLGDTRNITTAVENPSTISSATVALNVKVPAGTFENNVCKEPGKAEIVWYIENRGSSDIEFSNIYYTK